jgi:hypothetical protein
MGKVGKVRGTYTMDYSLPCVLGFHPVEMWGINQSQTGATSLHTLYWLYLSTYIKSIGNSIYG